MRRVLQCAGLLLAAYLLWYGVWSWMVSEDVGRIKASIEYHNQQLKSITPHMVLKAERIGAAGFPFRFRVKAEQLSLSMIEGKETYLVRFNPVFFDRAGKDYRVQLDDEFDALYAADGGSPEHYRITMSDVPGFILRGDEGKPLTEYRAFLPLKIVLLMQLDEQQKSAEFTLPPHDFMSFYPIPKTAEHTLWQAVNVFREALIFGDQ